MGNRVRPVALAEAPPDIQEAYAGFYGKGVDPTANPGTGRGDGPGGNGTAGDINTTFALVPGALHDFPGLLFGLLDPGRDGPLDPALRELAILRVAVVMNCKFVYSQHVGGARRAGVSEEKLAALKGWAGSDLFAPAERAVMAAADELAGRQMIERVTFEHLTKHLGQAAIVELIFFAAAYRMGSLFVRGLEIEYDTDTVTRLARPGVRKGRTA
jgi:AhpD family alkylhydroperoxidase